MKLKHYIAFILMVLAMFIVHDWEQERRIQAAFDKVNRNFQRQEAINQAVVIELHRTHTYEENHN